MLSIFAILDKASSELEKIGVKYAIAGGLAANLYRPTPRATLDVDFAIWADRNLNEDARKIILGFGFEVSILRKADLDGGPLFAIKNGTTPQQLVAGRVPGKPEEGGLDFLLPTIPWVPQAVERAQGNLRDLGFDRKLPVITVEDVLVSKLLSFQNRSTRQTDLLDLTAILKESPALDNAYLGQKIRELSLVVPTSLHAYFHFEVLRQIRKATKKVVR